MIADNTDTKSDSSKKLYLSKGEKGEVYVNIQQLHQHQVKGIRFLYVNMLKSNPRVILNDPSGYGKTLQIVMFLSAVRYKLPRPILILCNDSEVEHWKEHFLKWTNVNENNMAIESTNQFINMPIHINTMKNLQQFSRRDWGILVVDVGDTTKEVFRVNYKADYIIWVSNVDMKKNLHTFSSIYKWFYPEDKFQIEKFTPIPHDISDIVKKAILLDAFLENIVLRRNNFSTPYLKTAPEPTPVTPLKPSRKGKDITGTKTKRTKRKLDNTYSDASTAETSPTNNIIVEENKISNKAFESNKNGNDFIIKNSNNDEINEKTSEMDVEDFIHSQKPISSEGFEDFNNSDNNSQHGQEENIKTKDNSPINENNCDCDLSILDKTDSPKLNISNIDVKNDITNDDNEQSSNKTDSGSNANFDADTTAITKVTESNGGEIVKDSNNDIENTKMETDSNETIRQEDTNAKNETKKRSDMDSILADLEAKTFKKFKGSLLDSIF